MLKRTVGHAEDVQCRSPLEVPGRAALPLWEPLQLGARSRRQTGRHDETRCRTNRQTQGTLDGRILRARHTSNAEYDWHRGTLAVFGEAYASRNSKPARRYDSRAVR